MDNQDCAHTQSHSPHVKYKLKATIPYRYQLSHAFQHYLEVI
jgi:hypothetical protein